VAARSQAWVCGRMHAGIVGSNPPGCIDVCLLLSTVYCQVKVSATGWSLVQRSLTECGVSECDGEASIMRRPWPTRGCYAIWVGVELTSVRLWVLTAVLLRIQVFRDMTLCGFRKWFPNIRRKVHPSKRRLTTSPTTQCHISKTRILLKNVFYGLPNIQQSGYTVMTSHIQHRVLYIFIPK
jgi:hypothetical protein